MRIWGMLSTDDENAGFDLVLDEEWYVLLLHKGEIVARFDPRDYTSAELHEEVNGQLQTIYNDPSAP